MTGRPPKPAIERLMSRVVETSAGCWVYDAASSGGGYRQISVATIEGRPVLRYAHRVSYESLVGPIPHGCQLDHLCRNRACVNPDHLEPVTPRQNTLRSPIAKGAMNAAKTHCPQGHEYTPENTYRVGKRSRQCKECTRVRALARYHAKRKASA